MVSLANDGRLRGGSAAGERHIQWPVTALAYLNASLFAAEMSWVLLEKPISRFKAKVPSSWFTEVAST